RPYERSSFFFSSGRRHTRFSRDWSSDVCSSDLQGQNTVNGDNNADNVEVIEIADVERACTITVAHKATLTGGSQKYSIIISGARSEERRVGNESRSRWMPERHEKKSQADRTSVV